MLQLPLGPGAHAVFTTREFGNLAPAIAERFGLSVHDVLERRQQLSRELGVPIAWMHQVHEATVVEAGSDLPTADGLVSSSGWAPAVVAGDCVPLLLASRSGSVRAAVHVGRLGLFRGVVTAAIDALRQRTSEDLFALAGPHICGSCYEVSEELAAKAEQWHGRSQTAWGTPSIDLAAGIAHQLRDIPFHDCRVCTREDARFYSYREDPKSGRFASIVLPGSPNTPRGIPRMAASVQ